MISDKDKVRYLLDVAEYRRDRILTTIEMMERKYGEPYAAKTQLALCEASIEWLKERLDEIP